MKDKNPYSHPLLYGAIGCLIALMLQAAAVICAFALQENNAGLIASLIILHGIEFIALLFVFANAFVAHKLKIKKRSLILVLTIVTALLVIALLAIEAVFFI